MNKTWQGVAYLAAQHKEFPYRRALRVFDGVQRPAIAVLYRTFGDSKKTLKHFIEQNNDRHHLIQFYLLNGVCQRKGNCKRGELKKRWSHTRWNKRLERGGFLLKRSFQARVRDLKELCQRISSPNTHIKLCVCLEDNYTTAAARRAIGWASAIWPCPLIRNPVGHNSSQSNAGAGAIEKHGKNPNFNFHNKFIWNMDGTDIDFAHRSPTVQPFMGETEIMNHLNRYNGKAEACYLWSGLHQGLTGDSGGAPPPRQRIPSVPMLDVHAMNRWLRAVN